MAKMINYVFEFEVLLPYITGGTLIIRIWKLYAAILHLITDKEWSIWYYSQYFFWFANSSL